MAYALNFWLALEPAQLTLPYFLYFCLDVATISMWNLLGLLRYCGAVWIGEAPTLLSM